MEYEDFRDTLLRQFRDFYGEADLYKVRKNNGQGYDGIWVALTKDDRSVLPVIRIDKLYDAYRNGKLTDIKECMEAAIYMQEQYTSSSEDRQFVRLLEKWNLVKDSVYPALLNTGWNYRLLKGLVSIPMLDLSIVYIIRYKEGSYFTYITDRQLRYYGVSQQELHRQALKNLLQDGYRFLDIKDTLKRLTKCESWVEKDMDGIALPKIYALTNRPMVYGAAGILDNRILQKCTGKRNFYILPLSVHETILIPDNGRHKGSELDVMIQKVNLETRTEERLSDHCYYYNGKAEEIKMYQ